MFNKKIEKLRKELRKEMLELADSREARLTRDFQEQIDFLKCRVDYLNFKLRANGAKYILDVSQRGHCSSPRVYIEYGYRGNICTESHYVTSNGTVTAKVVGNYIEIYDDGALVEVLTQCGDCFINVELEMYKNSKKYDEIYNQPVHAVKENDDVQQKEN